MVCPRCSFVTTKNPLPENNLAHFYSEGDDYTNYSSADIEKANYIERGQKCVKLLEALQLNYESVLDIGASTGYLLSLFSEKKVQGIETSLMGVRTAWERYHLKLYQGTFEKFVAEDKTQEKTFDLIIMMHVLEHVFDLNLWLKSVSKLASKYLYVEVPLLYTNAQEPFGLFAEEHLHYFTPASLLALMQKYGFSCVHLDCDYMVRYRIAAGFPMIRAVFDKNGHPYHLREFITSEQYLSSYLAWSHHEIELLKQKISSRLTGKTFAIWGASYQTERLLAYLDFGDSKLKCLFDNSILKQKYHVYYQGKEIPVLKPDKTNLACVDYVIISPWNNQKPIYEQICIMGFAEKAIRLY